jgi:predicted site-specific integrase-resolvase
MNDDNNDKYITSKEARLLLGVCNDTLRNWDAQSKIKTIRTVSGQRRYSKQDVLRFAGGRTVNDKEKKKIVYCRVSTRKQLDDLERQRLFMQSQYPTHEVVTDIGSGLNWRRKGLCTLLEQSSKGLIGEVVVAHKDRLCRFGYELIEFFLKLHRCKLIVLDAGKEEDRDKQLTNDILSIIHIYSCKQMGRRKYKRTNACEEIEDLS